MSKKIIQIGHTNISYIKNNYFIQEKRKIGFNHHINYDILKKFDFVPKLIEKNEKKLVWEYINGESPFTPSDHDLKEIALIFKKIHNSNLKFPKNNLRQRIEFYLNKINANIEEAHKYKFLVDKINFSDSNPCHIDPYIDNFIKTKNKIYLVDWEYATMGDYHFDLAYFIEGLKLNKEKEILFLKSYEAKIDQKKMELMKLLVHWLVILWAHSQKEIPFPLDEHKNYLINNIKKI